MNSFRRELDVRFINRADAGGSGASFVADPNDGRTDGHRTGHRAGRRTGHHTGRRTGPCAGGTQRHQG